MGLVAIAVRVPTLAEQSFWLDEAYTERLLRMSFGGMLHGVRLTESTPPVYYVLAWAWVRVFGSSELALRSLSALAGVLTVGVVYALCLRLAGRRAAVIAGILVALSPLLIWYSQEARSYSLAALLATSSLLCVVAYRDSSKRAWLVGWTVTAALGLATHYFVVFVVAPELAWLLWRRRRGQVVAGCAIVGAVAGLLVPLALAQRGTGHADYIAQGSLSRRLAQVPKQLLVGYATPSQALTAALAAALAAAGVVLLLRTDAARRAAIAPLAVGLSCAVVPAVLALAGVDFLDTRNVLPALPALLAALAIGFAAAGRAGALALTGSLAAVFVTVTLLVDTNARYQRDDWRGASHALGRLTATRAIVVTPGSGWIPLSVYAPGVRPLQDAAVSEVDVVAVPRQVVGGGIGPPPRLAGPLRLPAAFHVAHVTYAETYTVVRYLAPTAVRVTPASLAPAALGAGPPTVLLESARARS